MTADILDATMWEFPILEDIEDNLIDSYQVSDKPANNSPTQQTQVNESKKERYISEEEYNKLHQLRNEYETKVKLINSIFSKVTEISNHLDNEVIQLLDNIIRSAVKKIILREITLDKNIMTEMINHLKSMLDHDQEYLAIHVSPQDYSALMTDDNDNMKCLKQDANLNNGDIVIKSKYGEVKAVIDDRINELIRINND